MPIAELFLGAFIKVLFNRLASRELLNFARRRGIDKLLEKWKRMLTIINQVLVDAEDRQLTGDLGVKLWLENLGNLAYDIDDLLDEFATVYAENEYTAHSLFPSGCFRLSPAACLFDCKMRSKMEVMDGRLQEIISQKNTLSLRDNVGKRSAYGRLDKPDSTTNLTETCFVSREDEKMEILKLLIGEEDDSTHADLKVIPIVGMPGVGKTALAQQVYNDARVTDYFNVKAWACISDDFDMLAVTKIILQKTNLTLSCENRDLDWLQDKLKENLSEKKFLVVLDDVWNKNLGKWTKFLKPFRSGANGSKIIITTRDSHVAEIAHAPEYILNVLPRDACITLLAFHALGVGNFDGHPDLEALGRQIGEKCKGLPLAATTLGGLLSSNVSPPEWEAVLNSKIWDLPEESNDILPALKLSYLHLPSNLRRRFAYCAIFPKDHEIERDELIYWWIAEGLLEGKEGKNRWNAGLKYFNELVSRSLFQKLSGSETRFLMHDLVNDLAKLVAGATHFSAVEFEFEGDQDNPSLARHASFISSENIVAESFKIYRGMKRLRSFISVRKHSSPWYESSLSQKVLCDLLLELKYLRVLSLTQYDIGEVPDCIGKMKHLRHLNLSYTEIFCLPSSIMELYNLEALLLRGCKSLHRLPDGMEKLINLKFFDITDTPRLMNTPQHIGNLVGLEMLSKLLVGFGLRLKELKNLNSLRGELCISNLHKVREAEDARDDNLRMKEGLCRLTMQWSEDFEQFRDEELEEKVLDFLCPHRNLENLVISYCGGLEFPSWLGSPLYVSIVHIRLHGCRRTKALPSLGQLSSLKELHIEGLNAICTVGSEFYGCENPFPSLIILEFKDMPSWEHWSHCVGTEEIGVVFPCLEHLVIRDCPMLVGRLPSQLSSLIKLEIKSCPCMDASTSITSLPSLIELNFGGCNERVLKSLVNLTSLTALLTQDVAELTCLNDEFTSSLIKLEKLEMMGCKKLTYLCQDRDVIRNFACLKSLIIQSCPEFRSFVAGEGDIELPGNLETIRLYHCPNLKKLPSKMHTLSSLTHLKVHNCPNLVSFPETGIPTSVISLYIRDCKMLQSLPIGFNVRWNEPSSSSHICSDMKSCLQELTIFRCRSLPTSPFGESRFLWATLKRLTICGCWRVESLAEINLDPLHSLQEIKIERCYNLRSLPQGLHALSHLTDFKLQDCPGLELECFPPLPPSILNFRLKRCPHIKSLPNQLHRLSCLCDLFIIGCDSITCFPDGGLPPQLQKLGLFQCENMKQPVREWLIPLTSLEYLGFDGSIGGMGEEEDLLLLLPSSLLHLDINDMPKLKRLSGSLPPSLLELRFRYCPKLRKLPGLPPSLELFSLWQCKILSRRRSEPTGCYWPLIREIPKVELGFGDEELDCFDIKDAWPCSCWLAV